MLVYIIEDDTAVSDALSVLLEELGHQTVCFDSGEAFLAAARPKDGDMVLIDLGLPGIGGEEVVSQLETEGCPARIIVISGRSRTMIERSLPSGRQGVVILRKPLFLPALAAYLN
ncbi:response regulator [Roseibium litorale]|uniref:Response regulator n=1 Tax=Roseibium litorale TaxID=2803841 RepID=A0ABR9CUK9_9HYPH|nr:response regulator [Roseibium litorale]